LAPSLRLKTALVWFFQTHILAAIENDKQKIVSALATSKIGIDLKKNTCL
jgi:hypothetical protein